MPDKKEANPPGRWDRFLRLLRSRRFRVADRSMDPTLVPGDCLYVDRGAFRAHPPARGDLVVSRDPALPARHLVKRVAFVPGEPAPPGSPTVPAGSVYLLGDNPPMSRDSRQFGPVPTRFLVGRVYRCYNPPERRRDL